MQFRYLTFDAGDPDIHTPDLVGNVSRAPAMGAVETARFDDPGDRFVVFRDPEGMSSASSRSPAPLWLRRTMSIP